MLLLVMQPELDERSRLLPRRFGRLLNKPRHGSADMVAIGPDDIDRRPRQQPALGPRMSWARRLVVRIEQICECRVEHPIIGVKPPQYKSLKKPCRVC